MLKKELLATAKTLNIRGRSRMNKAQLQRAIDLTLGEPMVEKEEAVDSKQMLVSLTQDQNLKFDNGERVNIVEMQAPRDEKDVLFDDPSPHLFEDYDFEKEFGELLEIQEEMATICEGAIMYKAEAIRITKAEWLLKMQAEYALRRYEELRDVKIPAWREKLARNLARFDALPNAARGKAQPVKARWERRTRTKINELYEQKKEAWEFYEERKAAHKAIKPLKNPAWDNFNDNWAELADELWKEWHKWQAKCTEFTHGSRSGHSRLWTNYFDLVNDEDYLLFVQLDPEDIDDQSLLMDPAETQDCIRDTHFLDPFSKPDHYEQDQVEELPVRTYGYVAPVRDVTHEYKAESELEAEWNELDSQFMELLDEHDLSYA